MRYSGMLAVVSNQATVWGLGCTAVKRDAGKLTFATSDVCFVGTGQ
jgi:hypothetical protein